MTPSRNRFGIGLAVAAALGIVCHASPAMAVDGEVLSVTRTYSDGSSEDVSYVVEYTGAYSIKFEDADVGLGEDREVMTDTFVLRIPDSTGTVSVRTKASTEEALSMLTSVGEEELDSLGFRVTLVSVVDDVYTISITSEDASRALSHAGFFFEGPLYD